MNYSELIPFCSQDPCRHTLEQPFFGDGWYVATDGRCLVILKDKPEGWIDSKFPPVTWRQVMPPEWPTNFRPVWERPLPEAFDRCKECNGVGMQKAFMSCRECNGNGDRECDLGHSHKCTACNGEGETRRGEMEPCEDCDGTGKVLAFQVVRAFDCHVDNKYLAKLCQLPGLRVCETPAKDSAPILFEFDGGRAALMVVRTTEQHPECGGVKP